MKAYIFFAILLFFATSCARSYRDCALYQSSGKAKPIVTVLPVIDTAKTNTTSWSISEELTEKIQRRIAASSKLYLLKDKGSQEMALKLNTPNPKDLPEMIGKNLGAAQFVIVSELLDQDEWKFAHPNASEDKPHLNEIGGHIHLAMRVRVLDIRGAKPKVILQEVVFQDLEVSKPYLTIDYNKCHWGQASYEVSPLGISHNKLVRELVAHVEGYIGANGG